MGRYPSFLTHLEVKKQPARSLPREALLFSPTLLHKLPNLFFIMRVATVDGLVTLFYDGSKELYNDELHYSDETCRWSQDYWRERLSWQQVIVVDGVTEIPMITFEGCTNIVRVIFADTVIRIDFWAFAGCSLTFIKLPINLEYIGREAFLACELSSVFLPPRCRVIGTGAFKGNENLEILNVPQEVEIETEEEVEHGIPQDAEVEAEENVMEIIPLGEVVAEEDMIMIPLGNVEIREELDHDIVKDTKLLERFEYARVNVSVLHWLKTINNKKRFALHRVCASFEPTLDMIVDAMKEKGGPKAFKRMNSIGITPSQYLNENPYATVTEKEIIEKYVLDMTGFEK
ncbi:hypothetical protein CTEN210_13707 [Chaetoceros tenuissimus]|uniref:Leucine-rich repeat domain-containing protein n=1 Tax=Chaetoceros tenuissimus TaxID=426638 RepID=A0AAD3D5U4_9STRA|nr:hypothetical protein CTEN210_13707 [Chaetoceros tenuissimus]